MEGIKQKFAECKAEGRSAFVAYVTAGYPAKDETPDIMLAMEDGGAGSSAFSLFIFQSAFFTSSPSL
jgi:tryptophan synthase alpha subunit